MTLVKWKNPVTEPVISIPSLIDDFFGRDMNELFGHGNLISGRKTLPAVNIKETKDKFFIEVAAPGMKKEDFKIELEKNILTISSETETENEENDGNRKYTRREFSYQTFMRTFTLPQAAEREKISASYVDGLLNISIPKKEEAKEKPARKIEVR